MNEDSFNMFNPYGRNSVYINGMREDETTPLAGASHKYNQDVQDLRKKKPEDDFPDPTNTTWGNPLGSPTDGADPFSWDTRRRECRFCGATYVKGAGAWDIDELGRHAHRAQPQGEISYTHPTGYATSNPGSTGNISTHMDGFDNRVGGERGLFIVLFVVFLLFGFIQFAMLGYLIATRGRPTVPNA